MPRYIKSLLPFLLSFYCFIPQLEATPSAVPDARVTIDSLTLSLEHIDVSSKQHSEVSRELGKLYYKQRDYNNALHYFQRALKAAQRIGDDWWVAQSHYDIGRTKLSTSDYQSAITNCSVSMEICDRRSYLSLWLKNSRKIASSYVALGDYEQSHEYLLQALEVLGKENDREGMVPIYYEMGNSYFFQEQYEKALEAYQKALALPKDPKKAGYQNFDCTSAIGSVFSRQEDQEQSLVYNKRALQLAQELGYDRGIAHAKFNLAEDYLELKEYNKALAYYEQAKQSMEEINYEYGLIGCFLGMGRLLNETEQYDHALNYLRSAEGMAERIQNKSLTKDVYEALAINYERTKQADLAASYRVKHNNLKNSLINEETAKMLETKEARLEIQKLKREQQMLMLKKEAEIQSLQKYFLAATGFFLLLMLGLGFSRYRTEQRTNRILEEKNAEISLQNQQLARSNRDLKQFAYITSHDLKQPLRTIGGYASLVKRRYSDRPLDASANEFLDHITNAVDRMYTLLSDVLAYSSIEKSEDEAQVVSTADLIQQVLSDLNSQIQDSSAIVEVADDMPIIMGKKGQLSQLFQNLISNAIKFRGENQPMVNVNCRAFEEEYLFSVKDNGIGIDPQYWDTIFAPFKRLHGQADYDGSGIGLSICQKVVEQHNGRMWLDSSEEQGTTFFFSIPKDKTILEEMASGKAKAAETSSAEEQSMIALPGTMALS